MIYFANNSHVLLDLHLQYSTNDVGDYQSRKYSLGQGNCIVFVRVNQSPSGKDITSIVCSWH